jgi:surface protein
MEMMFFYSGFNNDISHWDVSNVTECSGIFTECPIEEKYKPKKFRL